MSSEMLKISVVDSVNVVALHLPEELDSTEFDQLNESLAGVFAPAAGKKWVLDLASVQYMGSAALGLVVNIRHQVKSMDGRLALCNMSPRLEKVFRACSLERLFTIRRTVDEAFRAVR